MTFLMGVDVGTSRTKVMIIDESGKAIANASSSYSIHSPKERWAEQHPDLWWNALKESLKKIPLQIIREVEAIGFSGQMHGTVILNKQLKPLRPAIIWADSRSITQCQKIYRKVEQEEIRRKICNPIMPGFTGPTLLWLMENEKSRVNMTRWILLPKDYVRLKLTGIVATDVSDASATLLFDVKRRRWATDLISELGIPSYFLPEVYDSDSIVGEITSEASEETGLPKGVPVIAGGGDSQVGAIGCGVIKEGIVSSNIGTGGQIFTTVDSPKVDPELRVHTFCHAVPKKWCLQGAILSAGLSLKWFHDHIALFERNLINISSFIDSYDLLSLEAEEAEPGCKGLIFLPYLLGERSPHMNPKARGVFYGLTLDHRRSHLIRAIMEGVVFALRDSLEIFKELGAKVESIVVRGGGAESKVWRRIQADIFGVEILRCNIKEDAAFGAALLAGVGIKVFKDIDYACRHTVRIIEKEKPIPANIKIYEKNYNQYFRLLYPALKKFWT